MAGLLSPVVGVAEPQNLRESYIKLHETFQKQQEAQRFAVNSNVSDERLDAEIFVLSPITFDKLRDVLVNVQNWCEFLPLHLNIKGCLAQQQADKLRLNIFAGRKFYEQLKDAHLLQYVFQSNYYNNYFEVTLTAPDGPLGTSNYLIQVEAMPVANGSFLRVQTRYDTSWLSRTATNVYLMTSGRNKIGFSREVVDEHGKQRYVKGLKGIIERNVVRYYLALKAYFTVLPDGQDQFMQRAAEWFDLTEQYHDQLYEMDKKEYLEIKQKEQQLNRIKSMREFQSAED